MGEVAPTYFASAAARERIAQTVPEAKIVCVFRNPAIESYLYIALSALMA